MKLVKLLTVAIVGMAFLFGCSETGIYNHPLGMAGFDEVNAVLQKDPKPAPAPTTTDVREKILFDFDSYKLDAMGDSVVEHVADLMEEYPDTILAIEGHTDKYGSAEYNQTLSEDRADTVVLALIDEGVPPESIVKAEGFGKNRLIPNLTNRENRRVIILSISDK